MSNRHASSLKKRERQKTPSQAILQGIERWNRARYFMLCKLEQPLQEKAFVIHTCASPVRGEETSERDR